ncbi:hypothetical protein [Rhizobium sp.]|uniref:hypothetical protein n=1 Tax=Rhizobium sp. TaxID=391 RepID=UPI0034C6CC00
MNAAKPKSHPVNQNDEDGKAEHRHCGIVMPIAGMPPEYDVTHWARVKEVLGEAITSAGFIPRLVSDSEEVGVIHGHIVQNLYEDEIVVCDVSGKNPNVMFELGMRLAFDKPTIVVKDDITAYSFDTSPIKHIPYRKDQRYDDVLNFKQAVASAIKATIKKKEEDEKFSPFLRHFGTFTPKKLENHELPQAEFIMKKLQQIEESITDFTIMQGRAAKISSRDLDYVVAQNLARSVNGVNMRPGSKVYGVILKNLISSHLRYMNIDLQAARNENLVKQKVKREVFAHPEIGSSELPADRFDELFNKAWNEVTEIDRSDTDLL